MRSFVAAAAASVLLAAPAGAAPAPQVVDPANDANGGAYWAGDPDTVTPVGSQPYADVTAVRFSATARRARGRTVVTGFTVTMTLTGAPTPPAGATGIYRVFAMGPRCVVAVDHYTRPPAGGSAPATALLDTCRGVARRTPLPAPSIVGRTITWTVPLAAVPRDVGVAAGTTLTDLHFEVSLAHDAACAGAAQGGEQPPCAVELDTTFRRGGSFTIR